MPSLVDATARHEDPGDPRGLVGDRDRRDMAHDGRRHHSERPAIAPLTRSERR